jgi:hypothetical protein
MTRNVLILAPTDRLSAESRTGDLFDAALMEIVRVLDLPASIASVLVPWTTDLAPLIAVGIADTAPGFDPEGRAEGGTRSGLLPYLPPGEALSDESRLFFASSHLALGGQGPMSLADAVGSHPPTDIVVLGWTSDFSLPRGALGDRAPRVVTFGSLASAASVASALDIAVSGVTDLERSAASSIEADLPGGSEAEDEAGLEPFVPFGLLIQDYFNDLIPDEGPLPPADRPRAR